MQAFTSLTGPAAWLPRPNVDTDVIIRIEHLARQRTATTAGSTPAADSELGRYAFEALRYRSDGSEDPAFVLNQSPYRHAPILLAGANFGCGSSREGAVTALMARGIRCVIAPSYGDIFYNNCFQNGLLPIRLPADQVESLAGDCAEGAPLTVDLSACRLTSANGRGRGFEIDPLRREALLLGLDDIASTLQVDADIRQWQVRDRLQRPWAWPGTPPENLREGVR